jgi:hypothetical protein
MSLIGSLEDLGLEDVFQILALSGKSGVLRVSNEEGEGTILFRNGRACAAIVKGGPCDLPGLLVEWGLLLPPECDAVASEAGRRQVPFAEVLSERRSIPAERLQEIRMENLMRSALAMLRWRSGEFRFEAAALAPELEGLVVEPGVDAQFLAMEGARLHDEATASGAAADPRDVFASLFAERKEKPSEPVVDLSADMVVAEVSSRPGASEASAPGPGGADGRPLVVIDPDPSTLEWVYETVADRFEDIHLCRGVQEGISRLRACLGRGQTPVLLLSLDAFADPDGSGREARHLADRLKARVPELPVLLLAPFGTPQVPGACDAQVFRPSVGPPDGSARLTATLRAALGVWAQPIP